MWWQACILIVVSTLAGAGLLILRARLAQLAPPASAGAPPELIAELRTIRTEWAATKAQLDSYLEALMDIEETVEHKRRRTASAASKLREPEIDPNDPAALRARARGLGLPV